MFEKACVFADVPSSTREKSVSGEGAVWGNDVLPSGVACVMIVIDPGNITAPSESERSWLPPVPSRVMRRVWYGEPGTAMAELPIPQSARVAMCPPHARTGLTRVAVNEIGTLAGLAPVTPATPAYGYAPTAATAQL